MHKQLAAGLTASAAHMGVLQAGSSGASELVSVHIKQDSCVYDTLKNKGQPETQDR